MSKRDPLLQLIRSRRMAAEHAKANYVGHGLEGIQHHITLTAVVCELLALEGAALGGVDSLKVHAPEEDCDTCKHFGRGLQSGPCMSCRDLSKWEQT